MKILINLPRKVLVSALTLSAAVAAFGVTAPSATAQEVTLKLHTFLPPVANPVKTFMIPWIEKVQKESNGRIKVQGYWAQQLGGKPPQLADQVKDGVVDIVWTLPGYTPGRFPKTEVFELPFVHRNARSTTLALQDFFDKHLTDEYKDFHMLLPHAQQGFLFQTKFPVTKFEDLKDRKLRAPTRVGVWMLEEMGSVGIGLPLPQIPSALSKGVVEGVLLPYEIAPAVKTQDLVSYFTDLAQPTPRLSTSIFTYLMNKDSYNKLPPDLKKVIDNNARHSIAEWAGQNWEDIEVPGRKVVESKKKNKFSTLSEAETNKLRALQKPVAERWFAEMKKIGVDGPALMADAEALVKKYDEKNM